MATEKELNEAGNYSLMKLYAFKDKELNSAKKCSIFQRRKRNKHYNMAQYYQKLIDEVGPNPNSITIACRVPDWVLEKMGWL